MCRVLALDVNKCSYQQKVETCYIPTLQISFALKHLNTRVLNTTKNSNLFYTHGITPKCVMSGGSIFAA